MLAINQKPQPERNVSEDTASSNFGQEQKSREPLWGALVFASMLLFVLASIGGIGWTTYVQWKAKRVAENHPSVLLLEEPTNEETSVVPVTPSQERGETDNQTSSVNDVSILAKKLEIAVLNGGAAKGSAGSLADFLKKEGYNKITIGNTLNNYTGAILYYAPDVEKEVASIKENVAKKYPQIKTLPADIKNK